MIGAIDMDRTRIVAVSIILGVAAIFGAGCLSITPASKSDGATAEKTKPTVNALATRPDATRSTSGVKWQEMSRDRHADLGPLFIVSRIPLPTRDGWLYRCVSDKGDVDMVVVPDDSIDDGDR
jgi:hypothetical protein